MLPRFFYKYRGRFKVLVWFHGRYWQLNNGDVKSIPHLFMSAQPNKPSIPPRLKSSLVAGSGRDHSKCAFFIFHPGLPRNLRTTTI